MEFSGWSAFPCEMRDDMLRGRGEGRPEGLHQGQVIRKIAQAVDPKAVTGIDGDQENVRMQEGFLWERALEYCASGLVGLDEALEIAMKRYALAVRPDHLAKQVALVSDGIHQTPDAVNYIDGEIESYKSTRKSLRKALDGESFAENFWMWHMAEKGYLYTLKMDTVRWIVLWHAGDYSRGPGSGPQMLTATTTYTVDEIAQNWKTILKHAEGLK